MTTPEIEEAGGGGVVPQSVPRADLEQLVEQLANDPAGRFNYQVKADSEDAVVSLLGEKVNQILRLARKSVNEARKKSYFLARSNAELKREADVRNRAEKQLLDSEARTRAIVESAAEGILTFDASGRILTVNGAAERAFGVGEEELAGRMFRELFAGSVDEGLPFADALDALTDESGETLCLGVDGTQFPVAVSHGSFDFGGDVLHTVVIRDLSEVQQMRVQLSQAQKLEAIGQLAAGMAHEINTPTQFVSDNVRFLQDAFGDVMRILDLLKEEGTEAADPKEILARMKELAEEGDLSFLIEEVPSALSQSVDGLETVANIVRAMKDFSHPGASERTSVDLTKAIQNTVTVARNEWKNVADVQIDAPEDLPPVPCFESEFNQVILNMIVNSAHVLADKEFGEDEHGRIRIELRVSGDWVEVRVEDNGGGIPEEAVQRVFDPFFTTKEVGKGTGQGLAIARSVIVDKHCGSLSVEETSEEGTTFLIRLPLVELDED